MKPGGLTLRARGLSVGYPGRAVLFGVDLEVRPGEVLAIIGPNGSGKTTLLKTLSGELKPLGGAVRLIGNGRGAARQVAGEGEGEGEGEGIEVSSLSSAARARAMARVLQKEEPAWPLPVRAYVEAGCFAASGWFGALGARERRAVDAAMEAMDLGLLARRPVTELSGGEFRRVLIARALAQDPSILLLDEPAADLDLGRQMDVLGRLRDLAAEGRAIAFSVHDLNLAALAADRVALVSGATLLASGSPREVITSEAVLAAYGASVLVGPHPLGQIPQVAHAPAWLSPSPERRDA